MNAVVRISRKVSLLIIGAVLMLVLTGCSHGQQLFAEAVLPSVIWGFAIFATAHIMAENAYVKFDKGTLRNIAVAFGAGDLLVGLLLPEAASGFCLLIEIVLLFIVMKDFLKFSNGRTAALVGIAVGVATVAILIVFAFTES